MSCNDRFVRRSGRASLTVTREQNLNHVFVNLEDLDRETERSRGRRIGTSALSQGARIDVAPRHTVTLFLSGVRQDAGQQGSARITLRHNDEILVDDERCVAAGANPFGTWTIVGRTT